MLQQLLARFPADSVITVKKWLLPLGGSLLITSLIVAILWHNNNRYVLLFGSEQQIPVAQAVEVLGTEGIAYRVEPRSGALLIAESKVPQARMLLAARGITAQVPAGYGLMDSEALFGSSQFIQNVRFRRSLEGELAQSIMTLDSVASARVHLGMVEKRSFVLSSQPDSTASVILRLHPGRELSESQVAAVIGLVAGSTPGMKAEQVQVVDQGGRLLSAHLQGQGAEISTARQTDALHRLRQTTERNISTLLIPLLGQENFRVSVVPQISFDRVEETQERYLGDPRTASENLLQENLSEQMAVGIPGSLSNRPANAPAAAGEMQGSSRDQSQRQFHWDRDIRQIRHQSEKLQKLSVAIVLNQNVAALSQWNEEQHAQLAALLSQAAGIDSTRGDQLTISRLAFIPAEAVENEKIPWWESETTFRWAERAAMALLILLITLFGLLPMLRRVGQPAPAGVPTDPALTQETLMGETLATLPDSAVSNDDQLPPQNSGLETKVAFLQTLARSETDRVAEVLKQWISSNERNNSKK